MLCPACGKQYEYCHGRVKTPYFRHKDKNECEDRYNESETEEHLNGKRDLYEWINNQDGVYDAVLEGWIPETKQRPDIMFKHNNKQYVIEYQCTPIASEYIERHELYQMAGITDIWVLGSEKYLKPNMRKKYIQDKSVAFYDSNNKCLIFDYNLLAFNQKLYTNFLSMAKEYRHTDEWFSGLSLNKFTFDNKIINVNIGDLDKARQKHLLRFSEESLYQQRKSEKHREKTFNIIKHVNKSLNLDDYYSVYDIRGGDGFKNIYLYANDLIRISKINYILKKYNNDNWHFIVSTSRKGYLLKAMPLIRGFYHNKIFQNKDLDSRKILNYCNNIQFLIQDLEALMKENIQLALNYSYKNTRIVEVQ